MLLTERYQIFDNLIEGVQVLNHAFDYLYVNEAVARHAKLDRDELLGQNMVAKFPGIEKTEMFSLLSECMKTGKQQQMMNIFDFPDGSNGYFELRMEAVPEGVLVMSFDVTEVMQAKELLKNTNEILEKKIAERTSKIEAQKRVIEEQVRSLEELHQTKDKFFGIIAHDLRGPLISLKSFASILLEDISDIPAEELKLLGAELNASLENTLKLADNLLNWARVQMDDIAVVFDHYMVKPMVDEVLSVYKVIAKNKNISVITEIQPGLRLYCDANHFQFILRNLVNNAIKFTKDKEGLVSITAEEIDGRFVMRVSDNGVGLSKQQVEDLHALKKSSGVGTVGEKGSGLGLILIHHFLGYAKGQLKIHSSLNEGSTFEIIIPIKDKKS